jgi:hypothetical protein
MCGVICIEVWSCTVMAWGESSVCWRCAGSPSGGPEYDPGLVLQHRCDSTQLSVVGLAATQCVHVTQD